MDPVGDPVGIRTSGISWEVDRERKFKRNQNYLTTQYRDVMSMSFCSKIKLILLDERFINWMSFSTLYNWKKLWGIIDQNLPIGTYEFTVNNSKILFSIFRKKKRT